MGHSLGHHQYGKAETRVVRVYRDREPHELVDLTVSAALSGDFTATHLTGDNAEVLTTDAVKNTVFAYAAEHGEAARQPESFGLALARHFVDDVPQVHRARVRVDAHPWLRLGPSPHAFVREGRLVRTSTVTYGAGRADVVSGLRELVVLKTTDSEFTGFYEDRYTTLQPTTDRVLATSVTAQWWHVVDDLGEVAAWGAAFDRARDALCEAFAASYSLALQQTLFEMGSALLDAVPSAGEVRLSLPNHHHFAVDLSPFGLANPNEVLFAADRPYGLIEGTVRREGAPEPGPAFDPGQGW